MPPRQETWQQSLAFHKTNQNKVPIDILILIPFKNKYFPIYKQKKGQSLFLPSSLILCQPVWCAWPLIMLNIFSSALTKNHQLYTWQSAGSEQPIIARHFSQFLEVETNHIFSLHLKTFCKKDLQKFGW